MINYKHIFSLETNYILKSLPDFIFKQKKLKNENDNKKIYFLDAPSYGNIGDQAIAFAMEEFMKDVCKEFEQIEIQEDRFANYYFWLKKNIKKDDIICLTGGGNMGDLYPKYEAIRRIVIKTFINNKIIIFPQTCTYGDSKYSNKQKKNSQKLYNSAPNLTLIAREENSYNLMKNLYPNCNVILSHDIVLSLNYVNKFESKSTIGVCLRNDKEKITDQSLKNKIYNTYNNIREISTVKNYKCRIDYIDRKQEVEKTLKDFAENELVITDRLHGMIFSYITNTPCICLPNSNGKVQRVYKQLQISENIKLIENSCDNVKLTKSKENNIMLDFSELKKEIRKIVYEN